MVGKKQKKFIASVLKMLYYKKLDLDIELLSKKTLSYASLHKDKIKSFWTNINLANFVEYVPEIVTTFATLNITPKRVSLITAVTQDRFDPGIHRDHTSIPVRINVPVLNCEYSQTKFWRTTSEPIVEFIPGTDIPYFYLKESDCELADTLVLDKPTVLRVSEPHSVHVGEKTPRLALTIEFEEDIEYLLND
jgi:hypothetical protein